MTKMTHGITKAGIAGLAALALLPVAGAAPAATFTKNTYYGDLLNTPLFTGGLADLTEIDGSLTTTSATATRSNPDLFAIAVTGLVPFSATTVGSTGTLPDTRLFLFNAAGAGVAFNDDASAFGGLSTLPATTLAPGLYYLGISTQGAIPASSDNPVATSAIFPDWLLGTPDTVGNPATQTGVYGPTGPGGSAPLSRWDIGGVQDTGSYQIFLTGAAGTVPEPATPALLAVGGLLLAAAGRRRRLSVN